MKHALLAFVIACVMPLAASAGELQKSIKGNWLGAWVIVTSESYSDCSHSYTNNRIHGDLVKSAGHYRFQLGELAKVNKIDLHKGRLDILMTLAEPLLVSYQDGPFTLYREAACKIELQVVLPREIVKGKDIAGVEEHIFEVVERYSTDQDARASARWNEREIEPYPDDYEYTLARHAVWQAEQTNMVVQAKIDQAFDETTRLTDRVDDDPDYVAGFARGVRTARDRDLDACSTLLAVKLDDTRRYAKPPKVDGEEASGTFASGYRDGTVLVYGLEMIRNLPSCFIPVPDLPTTANLTIRD